MDSKHNSPPEVIGPSCSVIIHQPLRVVEICKATKDARCHPRRRNIRDIVNFCRIRKLSWFIRALGIPWKSWGPTEVLLAKKKLETQQSPRQRQNKKTVGLNVFDAPVVPNMAPDHYFQQDISGAEARLVGGLEASPTGKRREHEGVPGKGLVYLEDDSCNHSSGHINKTKPQHRGQSFNTIDTYLEVQCVSIRKVGKPSNSSSLQIK